MSAAASDASFFLGKVIEILERLRFESEKRGHPLLASMLDLTKSEAEDDLNTREALLRFRPGPNTAAAALAEPQALVSMAETPAPLPRAAAPQIEEPRAEEPRAEAPRATRIPTLTVSSAPAPKRRRKK